MGSKIRENINSQGKHDMYKVKLLQDKLNEREKNRLDSLLGDIDDNLDEILKEKNEYYKKGSDTKSTISKASRITGVNVYNMSSEDSHQMQDINERLQKFNPGLIGSQLTSDHVSQKGGEGLS